MRNIPLVSILLLVAGCSASPTHPRLSDFDPTAAVSVTRFVGTGEALRALAVRDQFEAPSARSEPPVQQTAHKTPVSNGVVRHVHHAVIERVVHQRQEGESAQVNVTDVSATFVQVAKPLSQVEQADALCRQRGEGWYYQPPGKSGGGDGCARNLNP